MNVTSISSNDQTLQLSQQLYSTPRNTSIEEVRKTLDLLRDHIVELVLITIENLGSKFTLHNRKWPSYNLHNLNKTVL